MKKIILFIIFSLATLQIQAQKVGLVFSGGGATGFAHIGVLKALEENNIPIDYITGTSAGALIGGMYASGLSPLEIEAIVMSSKFQLMANAEIENEFESAIYRQNKDAEIVSLRLSKDSILHKSLPTNLLNPTFLDLEVLNVIGRNLYARNTSFDSLFIPFRCIGSNISTKKSILFDHGNLNAAVRGSMTYPFFISPIIIDDILVFDGGLYNNFPAFDMYQEFSPDYIIGSNVSYNEEAPTADDLMSQIKNMFSTHSNYTLPCKEGIVIEPNLGDVGTFDFDEIEAAIETGYQATILKMDSIKEAVQRRVSHEEIEKSRAAFNSKKAEIKITNIKVLGVDEDERIFISRKLLQRKENEDLDYNTLKKRYLNLYQSEHILSIFPTINHLTDSTQQLVLDVRKEKPFKIAVGGHYSSRPVNTGFLSVSYSHFKISPLTAYANSYFGKFYGSIKLGLKFYLPTRTTSYFEPQFVKNRWDYFRSLATFFEPSKPSYKVQNETYWRLAYHVETSSKSSFTIDFTNGTNIDEYNQTENFALGDTADQTSFLYYSPGIKFEIDNLNRKQFASAGTYFSFYSRFIHGIETTQTGSQGIDNDVKSYRNWMFIKMNYTNYLIQRGLYRLGFLLEGVYSIQPFFDNYTASVLSAHAFQPFPDVSTGFYNDFRANKYLSGGLMNVFTLKDKLDLRVEAYIFQPIQRIINIDGKANEDDLFKSRFGLASASLIYHTMIGPLRATLNYYDSQSETQAEPWSFQLSFGYIIFNEKGIQ
ncbi:patatin-like phospholipase family protein [Crocinitomix catalasitica]|uniref:patatin-like phospholipase family protein n=1 Tax=Crocinitomix catalasitica TaxID=184607 RepID=UPI00047F6AB8|nr:patatin-like phospholipase family protein [Crocinitomix catalasitica]